MALKELYEAMTGKTDFLKKVAGACFVAARDIKNEDAGTANHVNRLIWASNAEENCKGTAREMLRDVLSNATLAADVDGAIDSDIQFVVNSFINTYATGV